MGELVKSCKQLHLLNRADMRTQQSSCQFTLLDYPVELGAFSW